MESENATLNGCKSKLIIHRLSCLTNEMDKWTNGIIINSNEPRYLSNVQLI